eukprot:479534-Amphidinium_carterae.1
MVPISLAGDQVVNADKFHDGITDLPLSTVRINVPQQGIHILAHGELLRSRPLPRQSDLTWDGRGAERGGALAAEAAAVLNPALAAALEPTFNFSRHFNLVHLGGCVPTRPLVYA